MIERRPPKLLIASSGEGLKHAEALQEMLKPDLDASIWNEGFFDAGEFTLESLEEHSREFDGALVLATADDHVVSRSSPSRAPRDNLILEFGLFVAIFGRHRALLLVEETADGQKIPSDVEGLTYLPFVKTDPIGDGLEVAAKALRARAKRWQEGPLDKDLQLTVEKLLRLSIMELQDRAPNASDLGMHLYLIDKQAVPAQLIRVARERLAPKSSLARTFARGEGVVGSCWSSEQSVHADFTQSPLVDATRDDWEQLSSEVRFGMDWELLESGRERYAAIVAVPVTSFRDETGFVGCVACNVGTGTPADVLRDAAVMRVLYFFAETMRSVLGH